MTQKQLTRLVVACIVSAIVLCSAIVLILWVDV